MVDKEALERLEHKAKYCVTHHHACDCREYAYKKLISDLEVRLAVWLEDNIAHECVAEVAHDYYHWKTQDQEGFKCGKCHEIKPNHRKNCIVGKAGTLLGKLREMGEV